MALSTNQSNDQFTASTICIYFILRLLWLVFYLCHQYCIIFVLNVRLPKLGFPSGITAVTIRLAFGTS